MEQERQDRLIEQALHWVAVLNDEAAGDAERQGFDAWLSCGPDHAAAWARAQHVWARAGLLAPAANAWPRQNGGPDRPAAAAAVMPMPATPRGWSRRRWLATAAAASVATLAAGHLLTGPGLFADHSTGIGERRSIALADGSSVELGSASALSVAYTAQARTLTLHAGEAFFQVAADPARPFMVRAGDGETRALGTAFDVKRADATVTVTVAEHVVAVAAPNVRDNTAVQVGAAHRVSYGPDGLGPVLPADLRTALAWRRDRLVFHDAPLGAVVAELERYRSGRVLLTDDAVAAMPVTAVIDTGRTDDLLRTIADTLPVRVRRITDLLVLIGPAGGRPRS